MTMPYGALPQALITPGEVPVRSDNHLADDVNAWVEDQGTSLRAHPVAKVQAAGGLVDMRPMDLLQRLGRATSSLPPLYAPGAANMVGLSALRMSSQWAVLKYLWAFDRADPRLRLSGITDHVRSHQRAVFSEQLGIAVATSVVEELLVSRADGPPRIVDADAWESDPKVYRWIGDLAAHRPDYFFYTTGVHPKLFVVEVKGTSSSRAALVRQLARGVEQVGRDCPDFS